MSNIENALTSVSKKYVCDECGDEFQTHKRAVVHASKCNNYSIQKDETVQKVKA